MIDLETRNEKEENVVRPRLLLADDSATIRKVVGLTFADEGIDVTAVGDASLAMEEFVKVQPDIVLVDINLPGTSGYKICEMIKQDDATTQIPVLLLVGSFEPFDQDEAERVGADGYLLKPFKSIRELVSLVRDLLAQPSVDDPPIPEVHDDISPNGVLEGMNAESSMGVSEIDDIENLYQQSFVDTAEIQDFDTVDELLPDAGMDDELIDEKYPFDSERESSIEDTLSTNGPSYLEEFDRSLAIADESDFDSRSTDEGLFDSADGAHPPVSTNGVEDEGRAYAQIPSVGQFEPSEELITLIVNRVVERVSGREIREVAREVVPRIAEKLIREALADEKKS